MRQRNHFGRIGRIHKLDRAVAKGPKIGGVLRQEARLALRQPHNRPQLVVHKILAADVQGAVGGPPILAAAPLQARKEEDGRLPRGMLRHQGQQIVILLIDAQGGRRLSHGAQPFLQGRFRLLAHEFGGVDRQQNGRAIMAKRRPQLAQQDVHALCKTLIELRLAQWEIGHCPQSRPGACPARDAHRSRRAEGLPGRST